MRVPAHQLLAPVVYPTPRLRGWARRTFFTATACSHHMARYTQPYAPEPSSHSLPSGRRQMVISSGAMAHVSVLTTRGSPPPLSRLLSRLLRVLARSGPLPAGSCRQACRRASSSLKQNSGLTARLTSAFGRHGRHRPVLSQQGVAAAAAAQHAAAGPAYSGKAASQHGRPGLQASNFWPLSAGRSF